ncbi:TonB-dependent copper receptor [Thiopseudomonas alkaliphila]|uniref:TonB-dependent copper receptor n=1 Tax=Thiopseudomonas alkaliphila TaxID=1697053 RepID=UPI002577A781|nr:TonB-dependent copper receptor [Thiopseudomonas alkaliphila]MDM1708635.1 TonB-dependent copper receptor [Thiopseudomonas alkaliphila]
MRLMFSPTPVLASSAVVLVFACFNSSVWAETVSPTVTFAPSVVTGVAQSSPITVVTDPKQPRQPVPASDAADYLKTIPGFSAIRSGGVNSDPVFRGMFGSRLKLLTNGGEMIGACPSRMDSPSSYISPENYDQLTVIKGPQTVQWGPGNSAATILFERGPEQLDGDYRLDASAVVGSHRRFDRNLDTAVGNHTGYLRFTGNKSKAHDYNDGNGDRVPSRWNKWNSDLALGWTPTADSLLELTLGKGDGESRYAGRGMDGTMFKRESAGLRFKQSNLSENWHTLEAQVYYNYADHLMDNFRLRPFKSNMPMSMNVDRRTLGGRVKSTWQWEQTELIAGVDAQRSEHRKRMGMGFNSSYKNQRWNKDADFHQYGVFSELTWYMNDQQRTIGGIRVDRSEAQDFRAAKIEKRTKTLPSAFARYEHDLASVPATSYIGLGHVQRFPDYWELFSGGDKAFSELNPEKTTQLDFGIQYAEGPYELWAAGYLGHVDDYIIFDYGSNGKKDKSRNVNARIWGGEVGGSHRFAPGWKGDVSLAYAYGKNTSDGRALPQIPPLEAKLGVAYEQERWSAGGLWRVVAKQTRTDATRGNVVGRDYGDSAGFAVLSFNGAYQLAEHWKISAGLDNVLNKNYSEHLNLQGSSGFGYPDHPVRVNEAGRTWWTRLDMKF